MPDSIKADPPKIVATISNIVLWISLSSSLSIIVFSFYRVVTSFDQQFRPIYFIFIIVGFVLTALFIICLRLDVNKRINYALMTVALSFSILSIEVYFEFFPPDEKIPNRNQELATELGVPFDSRSKGEVVTELRNSGVKSDLNWFPSALLTNPKTRDGLDWRGDKIYPLSGLSNITTILNNESGFYPIVMTDQYGFTNSKAHYGDRIIDVVLVGDSFAEGDGVESDENISATLRKHGHNVISFGKIANGPLIELATVKEYAEPIKPKIVLWLFYTNDFPELSKELVSGLLSQYLYDKNYSQNLISRQDEVDEALFHYFYGKKGVVVAANQSDLTNPDKVKIAKSLERTGQTQLLGRVIKIVKLYNIRTRLNLTRRSIPKLAPEFTMILKRANEMVTSWHGKLYFVFLPSYTHLSPANPYNFRNFVLTTATKLGIPIIDLHKEIIVPHADPLSLFPFRSLGHYNKEGYRLVAEAIANRLREDGLFQ